MQETETIDQAQSKDSLAKKKESSEGSGLLSSIDHNVTDAINTIHKDYKYFTEPELCNTNDIGMSCVTCDIDN